MHDEGTDSKVKVFANIFISFIGAGILGLPYAFREVSLIVVCETSFVSIKLDDPTTLAIVGWSY
jgi:amino acid permease